MSYLFILEVSTLSGIWFSNIFSYSKHCLFILLMIFLFVLHKPFYFDVVSFIYFCFYCFCFWCQIQNSHCQDLGQGAYPFVFFSEFYGFWSYIWVDFCLCFKVWVHFHYFAHGCPVFPITIYWQDYPFPIVYFWLLCYKLLFSLSVMSNSFPPHGLQHTRLPCPSASPGPCSNSCPLSQWCHPTISSLAVPFSSCPQPFPASGSFLVSWLFASGGQINGASASASVFQMNIQGWFPLGLTGLISLQSRGLSRVLKNISSSALSFLYSPTLTSIHDYWRNHGFD